MKPAPYQSRGVVNVWTLKGRLEQKLWSSSSTFCLDQQPVASRLFKILYISSTFTNITISFISINFAILWNAWFSKISCKIYWSNVFFFFPMSFLKSKHSSFCFFVSMLRMTNLFFAFKNKSCCHFFRFYHECAFELTDWLIWLVHQVWLVYLN